MSDTLKTGAAVEEAHQDAEPFAPSRADQYKIVIEDARSLRVSRDAINDLCIGLVTLMLGAQGYLIISFGIMDVASTFYLIGIAVIGFSFCHIWKRVMSSYRQLLNYRYRVLKYWEDQGFPGDQKFYISEDALYIKDPSEWPTTPLTKMLPKSLHIRPFVDLYGFLPNAAQFILVGVALVHPIVLSYDVILASGLLPWR